MNSACARTNRSVSQSECCEIITTTVNSSDLASCRACPSGAALMGTARIGKQEDNIMPNGKCQCCGATAVIYRKGGVNRCYHCHKSEAEPMDLPGEKKADEAPEPAPEELPVSDEVAKGVHTCLPLDEQGQVVPASKQLAFGSEDHFADPGKMALPTLSWDDFLPIERQRPRSLTASVREGDKITFSVDLTAATGWEKGQIVEVRASEDKTMLALAVTGQPHQRGKTYVLTLDTHGVSFSINCGEPLKVLSVPGGKYHAEVMAFGVVVHLDRPVIGKA